MKNVIVDKLYEVNKGLYCHALECEDVNQLKTLVEELTSEFIEEGYTVEEIKDFFDTIQIIYYTEEEQEIIEEEKELYDFDIDSFIDELI